MFTFSAAGRLELETPAAAAPTTHPLGHSLTRIVERWNEQTQKWTEHKCVWNGTEYKEIN